MNKIILSELPLVEKCENFLSDDECKSFIEFALPKLTSGRIISSNGKSEIDYAHRNASSASVLDTDDLPIKDIIFDRVSETFGIDKSRFEKLTIINYKTGEEFKLHQDYFIDIDDEEYRKSTSERCRPGGNRVSTLVFYLNDVAKGGETYFPWINIVTPPEKGTVIHFDYGYDEWKLNIKSQHAGMPILEGEKWIMTIWVREYPLTTEVENYKKFEEESAIYSNIKDIEYELEVGPAFDRTTLSFILPANADPTNTILVGFTGGVDSALVLYLVAMLNKMQEIPYIIQPICVTSRLCNVPVKIAEDWINVEFMCDLINKKVGNGINKVIFISAPPDSPRELNVRHGLLRFFNSDTHLDIHRFQKYKYIYVGDNAVPNDPSFPHKDAIPRYNKKAPLPWLNCLVHLYKYHIIDALVQLGLEDIIEKTARCSIGHETLDEPCVSFQCNERRWAFTKINTDMGIKYLTNRGQSNDNNDNDNNITDTTSNN